MIDSDLANLYDVSTKQLNQAVKRNINRFPDDFMFQISPEEASAMRSQIVTTSKRRIGFQPLAFTEQGVAMLSSVLRSERAVQMNIIIMRAFVRLRELIATNKDVAARLEKLEQGHQRTNSVLEILVEDIDRLARDVQYIKSPPAPPKRKIGYIFHDD